MPAEPRRRVTGSYLQPLVEAALARGVEAGALEQAAGLPAGPVRLTIVDPLGQTRAIATQLIPPGAFTKLILPPLRDAPPAGPAFQFGIGVLAAGSPPAVSDAPRSAAMLDVGRAQDYWEWDDAKPIRLVLTFKQKDQTTRHEFTLRRTKL